MEDKRASLQVGASEQHATLILRETREQRAALAQSPRKPRRPSCFPNKCASHAFIGPPMESGAHVRHCDVGASNIPARSNVELYSRKTAWFLNKSHEETVGFRAS